MYKLILCWRYLQTRYIALASVISVTLGVATLIVVNSVMSGFTHEMQYRIHGILSDLVFDGHGLEGFSDSQLVLIDGCGHAVHLEDPNRTASELTDFLS